MRVEVLEDIKDSMEKRIIAKRGRQGEVHWLDEEYADPNNKEIGYWHIGVKLDGNKIRRSLPNWKLRIIN